MLLDFKVAVYLGRSINDALLSIILFSVFSIHEWKERERKSMSPTFVLINCHIYIHRKGMKEHIVVKDFSNITYAILLLNMNLI